MSDGHTPPVKGSDGVQPLPTLREIEDSIPDERKRLSFGDEGETVIDIMEQAEKDAHHQGQHMDEELETCPHCPDPENERVSPTVVGGSDV